jgi:hypothetical protein
MFMSYLPDGDWIAMFAQTDAAQPDLRLAGLGGVALNEALGTTITETDAKPRLGTVRLSFTCAPIGG